MSDNVEQDYDPNKDILRGHLNKDPRAIDKLLGHKVDYSKHDPGYYARVDPKYEWELSRIMRECREKSKS